MKRLLLFILFASITTTLSFGQALRVDPNPAVTTSGTVSPGGYPALYALQGANVNLYTDAAATIYATTYTDATASQACPAYAQVVEPGAICVSTAGQTGNFGWWITPGSYFYTITSQGTVYGPFPIDTNIIVNSGGYGVTLDSLGCTPSNSPTANNTACQNAVNSASALGVILTCVGTYQISLPLTIVNGLKIFGNGAGTSTGGPGCTIQQTTANPIWSVPARSVVGFQFQDIVFKALVPGSYGISTTGTDASHEAGWGDVKLYRTQWTVAGDVFYWNQFSFVQDMYTEYNGFTGGGAGTSCWHEVSGPVTSASYIVSWETHHDTWGGCDVALDLDTPPGGNAGGWDIFQPHFLNIGKTIAIIAGNVVFINIQDWAWENVGNTDPTPLIYSTCTTSGTSQTTVTSASSSFVNGQTITIQGGAVNGAFGGAFPGWDYTGTITSGGGTTTLTVSPAVPLQVSSPLNACTNAQYDGWTFVKGSNSASSPQFITIKNGNTAGIHRYAFSIATSPFVTFDDIYMYGQGILYDPNAYAMGNFMSGNGNVRTAFPTVAAASASPVRFYDGNLQMPTYWKGNPGLAGGEFHLACGDGSGAGQCEKTGNFGPWIWSAYTNSTKSQLYMDPNTQTSWFGKTGAIATGYNNLIVGPGSAPTGASNTFTLSQSVQPSGGTANQGTFDVSSDGNLFWTNGAGTRTQVSPATSEVNYFPAGGTIAIVITAPISTIKVIPQANVTSSTISGAMFGQVLVFNICQPSSGGPYTWTWPPNFIGGMTIGTTANKCNLQQFLVDNSNNYYALSAGVTNQ